MPSKRETIALVGAVCILFAVLTHNILSFESQGVELGVGFRGLSICSGGSCATTNTHSGLGTFAFVLGILSAASLGGAVFMERTQEDDRLWRPAGLLSLLFVLTVIAWYVDMSMGGASIGIGLWLGVPGAGAAAFVSLASDGGDAMAPFERMADRNQDIEAGLAKYYKNPVPSADPAAPASPSQSTASPSLAPASPSPASASPSGGTPAPASPLTAPVASAAEAVAAPQSELAGDRAGLRFVAASAVISDDGILATFADGHTQALRFGEVKQLVARRLPVELGHGPALLLDLVANNAPHQPIRILPATEVNYRYLPTGASLDPNENVRGLVKLVLALQPELTMDEGSKLFAQGASTGLPFKSVDHFRQYDGRYPA